MAVSLRPRRCSNWGNRRRHGGLDGGTGLTCDRLGRTIVGDLGEVTYDVVGLPDDATYGARLHVFGTPASNLPGSALKRANRFSLKTVESTSLCRRGVTADGLCV